MRTFFTADLHFLDTSIERYSARGDAYRAAGFLDHDSWVASIWNSQVNDDDLVYVLGDLSFAASPGALRSVLDLLAGYTHLVKGNHDRSQALLDHQHPRLTRWSYRQSVFVGPEATQVVMTHEPLLVWVGQHHGAFHLHGHTHGRLSMPGRSLDVGLDSAYRIFGQHRLFSEDDIVSILGARSVVSYDGRRVSSSFGAPHPALPTSTPTPSPTPSPEVAATDQSHA